jgi:hypothetical protein
MKTNILRFSAVLLVSATLFSCGGGKTAEDIQAEAQAKFDEATVELTEEASVNCESNMAAYTAAALDSIKMAN